MKRIAVLVSGGGTNLQALLDSGVQNGEVTLVVSSNSGAYALERARAKHIDTCVVARKEYDSASAFDGALLAVLRENRTDLVVLAGFLSILGPMVVREYADRIINVHPSLIPSFCGKGCYGLKVHEMALEYGVKVTGATVHFVNEIPDGGAVILQKAVDILPGDTPQILQKRVMEQAEWVLLPRAVSLFCQDRLVVEGRKVRIKETKSDSGKGWSEQ